MMLADFHLHSNMSYDNTHGPTINQIITKANQLGLQCVSITDHDQIFLSKDYQHFIASFDILPISGTEISCDDGHLIVLGIDKQLANYRSVKEAIDDVKSENVAIIAAHPFDPKYGVNDLIYNLDVDAIEINGRRTGNINRQARQVANDLGLPMVGSSDAHSLDDIGTMMTMVNVDDYSQLGVITAIKNGNCRVISRGEMRY